MSEAGNATAHADEGRASGRRDEIVGLLTGPAVTDLQVRAEFSDAPNNSGDEKNASSHHSFPVSSYVICTNPRSGSWLLSDGLAYTLVAGNPREWFNVLEEQAQRLRWHLVEPAALSYSVYLDRVLKSATTINGVCGIKMHYYQLTDFARNMGSIEKYRGLPLKELFAAAFPNLGYIWLTRCDKARQAISYHRACQTNEWWILNDTAGGSPPSSEPGRAVFDPEAIAARERLLASNDRGWQRFFEESSIEPLIVTYEDLAADYISTIVNVLNWLRIPNVGAINIRPARFIRQSDPQTEEWLERYLKFKAARPHPSTTPGGKVTSLWPTGTSISPRPKPPDSNDPAAQSSSPHSGSPNAQPGGFPLAWKHWIAHSILDKVPDAVLIETLVEHGYSRERAARDLAQAATDPYLLAAKHRQELLDKAVHLLTVFDRLASLHPDTHTVQRRTGISSAEFREQYYTANRPVILQGLMRGWPAMTLWTPAYLKSKAGDARVEIMANRDADLRYEVNSERHRKLVRFADYVDMVYSGRVTNDYYMVAKNGFFHSPSGHSLLADFSIFPKYLDPDTAGQQCFLWFGPAGTVTPLHHDACNILACQVTGRKHFYLVPATQWPRAYTDAGFFSGIDAENPDLTQRPRFREATVLEVTLEPGEALFIPVGWSHQVRTLEPSIMISFTNFLFPNHYEW
jgi:LPS sulfotransferase NodH